jgi:hypothetical protein
VGCKAASVKANVRFRIEDGLPVSGATPMLALSSQAGGRRTLSFLRDNISERVHQAWTVGTFLGASG